MAERRQVPRYVFGEPAQLSLPPNGPVLTVTLLSLSVDGCRVEGPGVPAVKQKCHLLIQRQTGEIRSEVQVMWKRPPHLAGLRFLAMDDRNLEALRNLCATLRLQPLVIMPPEPD